MKESVRRRVAQRAQGRCEYCQIHEDDDEHFSFHVEHVIAQQHHQDDRTSNLCYSRRECNFSKGTNLAGFIGGRIIPLFNPRRQLWRKHFRWVGPRLVGRTQIGKVTINVLRINDAQRIKTRESLIAEGRFPPS
jgi:hypothetical protein